MHGRRPDRDHNGARARELAAADTLDPRALSATALLRQQAERAPAAVATYHRSASGTWVATTWADLWEEVQRTAAAFTELGLRPGDRLAVLAGTRREWQIAELAGMLAGAAIVGIDPQAASPQVTWILQHARATALVVDGAGNVAKIPAALRETLAFIILLDSEAAASGHRNVRPWRQTLATSTRARRAPAHQSDPDAAAMVIYTSGTTGTPKAIEYSHRQLMTACRAMLSEFPDLRQSNRLVCWLPMAALFQRMLNLVAIAGGSVTYFVEDPRDIVARLADIRPTIFFSVPRFYEKVHAGIQQRVTAQQGVRRRLAEAALATGAAWARCVRGGARPGWMLRLRHRVLDRLVLRRMRAVMGGEIKWMISGSAAAPLWLLEFFHSIGLLLLEAYGITENPVPIAANRPDAYRFGSVGRPFRDNTLRLSDEGEVLVKGPAVFLGYLGEGRPPERFTSDGYYRSGDFGRFDDDGFLYLTGRVAEIVKTSAGRRISPVAIENVYRQTPLVDQIVIVGNNRPHLVALIVMNAAAVEAALAREGRAAVPGSDLSASPDVRALVDRHLTSLGQGISRHEQVRAFALLGEPFTVENGLMTPTLKPRRDRIEERYSGLIDRLYGRAERATLALLVPPGSDPAAGVDP